jgi:hypothetical protein
VAWEEGEIERMKEKVAENRKKIRELEVIISALRGELAQEMERRSSEGQAHATEKGEASRRHAALAASLECSQRYQILINSE